MSDNITVQRASYKQRSSLLGLWHALYQWHHEQCADLIKAPCLKELEAEMDRYLSTPDCAVFVVLHEERICGYITGQIYELTSPLTKCELIGSIDHWFVATEQRKNGLGLALMERMEQEFSDCGVKRVNVEVWDFNNNALEVYKSRGFQTHIRCMTKPLKH